MECGWVRGPLKVQLEKGFPFASTFHICNNKNIMMNVCWLLLHWVSTCIHIIKAFFACGSKHRYIYVQHENLQCEIQAICDYNHILELASDLRKQQLIKQSATGTSFWMEFATNEDLRGRSLVVEFVRNNEATHKRWKKNIKKVVMLTCWLRTYNMWIFK